MKLFNRVLTVLLILLIGIYSHTIIASINSLEGNYLTVYSMIGIVMVSLILILSESVTRTSLGRFWVVIIVWVLFEYVIRKTGAEAANIFRMTFCPFTFLALYTIARKDTEFVRTIVVLFLLIFLDNSYLFYQYGFQYTLDSDGLQTNYIFWPFCVAPFIFLIERKIWKWTLLVLLVVMSIISMKRSIIIVLLLMIPFLMNFKKLTAGRFIIYTLLVVAVSLVLNKVFSNYIGIINTRFGMMSEDEGSGRIPIFIQVWNKIKTLDFLDLLIGRGFGKIAETGYSNAHNDILQTIYEYGLVGLTLYVVLFIRVIKRCRSKIVRESIFSNGYYMTIIILIVMGLVSNLTVSFTFFVYLCAYWGVVEGCINSPNNSFLVTKAKNNA